VRSRLSRLNATDVGLLVLRLGCASLLIGFHGWIRLHRAADYVLFGQPWTFVSLVARLGFPWPPAFAVASAMAESIAAACMAVGLWTRWAAGIVAFNMAVALANEAFKGDPIELPALYFTGALVVAILGAGRVSLDGWRLARRERLKTTRAGTRSGNSAS
jgi:putative oxidoreductase